MGKRAATQYDTTHITGASHKMIAKMFNRINDIFAQQDNVPVTFQDGKSLVSMMKTANCSSFLHESGDIFLKGMANHINSGKVSEQDIADCPHKYKQRAQTVYFRFVRIT